MDRSRRRFLEDSAGLLAASALLPNRLPRRQRTGQPQRILIAGAGIAGLVAAYELQRAGHDVLVFEAKSIPGGHVHTVRAPFADGLYAEAGAMYLLPHPLTLEYVRAFGLPMAPVPFRTDLGSVAHVAGHRVEQRPGEPVEWPLALGPGEAGQSIAALQQRYHYSRISRSDGSSSLAGIRTLEELNSPDYPQDQHLALDDISAADFWRANGASREAIRLMRLRYFDGYGDGIESVSALQLIRERASFLEGAGRPAFQIRGGNDLLPRAFADRLSNTIRYGSPVVAVRHGPSAVEIAIEDRAGRHQVRGDRLIVTLPPPLLRQITFTPALPERRQRAIQEIETTPMTLVFMQTRERFWEADGHDGSSATDLPIMQNYHSTLTQPGRRGILNAMVYGPRAARLAAMDPEERLAFVAAETARVYPRLSEYYEGGTSYSWTTDRWSLGGHVYFKPGQIRAFFPYVRRPERRIHFAGDWVGGVPGYLHGAVISAHAAVKDIEEG